MPNRIDRPLPPAVPSTPNTTPSRPVTPVNPVVVTPADRFVPGAPNSEPIRTLFTPNDEVKQTELAAIDEIINARAADPKQYSAASNPYRIEYAIYNMTDRDIIKRLVDASRAGIKVQVLIEDDQIGDHKPYNRVVKDLVAGGFTHAESNKGLSPEQLEALHIIEIALPGRGLFHFKSRYFAYPDPSGTGTKELLLTGSHNPQNSAQKNDESFHVIKDPALIQRYVDAFHAIRDGKDIQNSWDDGAGINVLFTHPTAKGPRPVDKILELVDKEQELIFLTTFNLRDLEGSSGEKIVDKLIAAHNRGVQVIFVTDRFGSDGSREVRPGTHGDATDERLAAAGIPVYEYVNKAGERTAMHLKSAVFGLTDMKVVTDTGNWTKATMGSRTGRSANAESLLFIDSKKLDGNHTGRVYLGEFLRVLRKYGDQNGPENKPVEQLIEELQRKPNWPQVNVNFDVVARALPGQEVYLTGNAKPLGNWGSDGVGLKLQTDPAGQPTLKAEVALPLGTRLEYKIVKRDAAGALAHEPGENAILVVDPTVGGRVSDRQDVADTFDGE